MRKLPSGNWNTVVKVNGKCISVTAPTKAECEYKASQYKTKRRSKSSMTVRECIEKYIEISEVLSPTTLMSYERILEYAFRDLMDKGIDELDNITVQNAINLEAKRKNERTGKQISPKTVKNEWGLVSSALRTIASRSYMIKLPKIQRKNEVLPEPGEVFSLIKGTDIELPCLLAMWCGMRISEIRGLTYDSIHEDHISIDKVLVDVHNEPTLKALAKTDMSIRNVPLPNYIKELINTQDGPKTGLVVPFTRNTIYHRFIKIMRPAGVQISFHDLRHIYASVMLTKLQVPEKIVQKTGGWKTDTVMKTIYSNSFSESERDAFSKLDDYFMSFIS